MKRLSLFIYFFLITVLQAAAQQSFDKTAVKSVMKRVADWQIANPNKGAEHDDLDWTHAALYMGMLDWAELTEKEDSDDSYYQWLLRIGQRNHFQIGKWMYHADFIAVGQPFIDLYLKYGNKKMIAPVMAMYISLVRREWGRVHCSVLCCFSTMPINLSSASPRRRRVLTRSTSHILILTSSMR